MAYAVSDVIERLSDLPPFPEITVKLLTMLGDETVTFEQLADVISADPSLVMKVIRMSNSPFYMLARPIESVKDAVLVLGIETLKNLTTSISIHKGLSELTPRTDCFDFTAFWKHSYATAIAANKVARLHMIEAPDRFYLAGLIHDMGKLVQAYYWPESWKAAMNILSVESVSYEVVELRIFASKHIEVTANLCRAWRFPEKILELLENMIPEKMTSDINFENTILYKANTIANVSEYRFPMEETAEQNNKESLEQYRAILDELGSDVEHQLSILND